MESDQRDDDDRPNDAIELALLASKVTAPAVARALLSGVYASPDLQSALRWREHLRSGERIITIEGIEVTRHALRTHAADDPQLGVIARGEEIERLCRELGVSVIALDGSDEAVTQ